MCSSALAAKGTDPFRRKLYLGVYSITLNGKQRRNTLQRQPQQQDQQQQQQQWFFGSVRIVKCGWCFVRIWTLMYNSDTLPTLYSCLFTLYLLPQFVPRGNTLWIRDYTIPGIRLQYYQWWKGSNRFPVYPIPPRNITPLLPTTPTVASLATKHRSAAKYY